MNGFNPVYLDDITDSVATIGPISDHTQEYDPRTTAVSHISFYGPVLIPEPGSIALFGSGLGLLGLYQRRRRARVARA
jgi:hypothetical protein